MLQAGPTATRGEAALGGLSGTKAEARLAFAYRTLRTASGLP